MSRRPATRNATARGTNAVMGQPGGYLEEQDARRALVQLLQQRGVPVATDDLIVKTTRTRHGDRVHIVIAINSAGNLLASLIARIAGRRNMAVGTQGVFILRPDDIQQLVRTKK